MKQKNMQLKERRFPIAHLDLYSSQMLGARLSGLREAERVLARMEVVDRLADEMQKIVMATSPTPPPASTTATSSSSTTSTSSMSSHYTTPTWGPTHPNHNGLPPIPPTPPLHQRAALKPILVKTRMTTN